MHINRCQGFVLAASLNDDEKPDQNLQKEFIDRALDARGKIIVANAPFFFAFVLKKFNPSELR